MHHIWDKIDDGNPAFVIVGEAMVLNSLVGGQGLWRLEWPGLGLPMRASLFWRHKMRNLCLVAYRNM